MIAEAKVRGPSPSSLNVATETVYSVKSASSLRMIDVGVFSEMVRGRGREEGTGEIYTWYPSYVPSPVSGACGNGKHYLMQLHVHMCM